MGFDIIEINLVIYNVKYSLIWTKIPWRITHQPKDGHPPEGSVLLTWNLAITHYSQNEHQVTTAMDGHLPSLGGSPANPSMVTHQPKDGHLIWPHLAQFGPVWPGLALFGLI